MRLINCTTLRLEEYFGSKTPIYSILSHTWGRDEVSFTDFTTDRALVETKEGFQKIYFTCKQALQDDILYAWVDTCCIDKSSSAELSEAINSMFRWYENAAVCYVYLSDVSSDDFENTFSNSRWFSRGWTLQELLAPSRIVFYDKYWKSLGSRKTLIDHISEITRIEVRALLWKEKVIYQPDKTLNAFCIAKRMSWVSRRETTRIEDTAYCMLGIFNINMPLLYGEGQRAFTRLQEEIIKSSNDNSILAWGLDYLRWDSMQQVISSMSERVNILNNSENFLASSPKDFKDCHDLEYATIPSLPFSMNNVGLQIQLPLVKVDRLKVDGENWETHFWIALLNCSAGRSSDILGILLSPGPSHDNDYMEVARLEFVFLQRHTCRVGPRVAALAVLQKCTITHHTETRTIQLMNNNFRHLIITESPNFRTLGYHVISATASFVRPLKDYYTWDSNSNILTTESPCSNDLVQVFIGPWGPDQPDRNFTIFMHNENFLVRKGNTFPLSAEPRFYLFLSTRSHRDDPEEAVLVDSYGRNHIVDLKIKETKVYHWRIIEVEIDLVRLENSQLPSRGNQNVISGE